jgi:hypothetical protein
MALSGPSSLPFASQPVDEADVDRRAGAVVQDLDSVRERLAIDTGTCRVRPPRRGGTGDCFLQVYLERILVPPPPLSSQTGT